MAEKAKKPAVKKAAAKAKPAAKAAKAVKTVKPAKTAPARGAKSIFFTGFPGFLGRRLVRQMTAANRNLRFQFLVQEKFLEAAKNEVAAIAADHPGIEANVEYLVGDLSVDGLGLDAKAVTKLAAETNEVWHLAAVYDLAVNDKLAWNINVEGARRVLDLCAMMKNLQKLVYFSTCYVSGLRTGLVLEEDLDFGQGFKNHYESSKFEAETLVRAQMDKIPTIIIRPSVVVGDSKTGETDKFDGPYYLIRTLADMDRRGYLKPLKGLRLPSFGPGRAYFNLVPVDFLTDAVLHIAKKPEAIGKTFAVIDPDPMTTREFYDEVWQKFGMGKMLGVIPLSLVTILIRTPVLGKLLHNPEQGIPYTDHRVIYDCKNTLDFLKDSDIKCPNLLSYLGVMIDFVREHMDKQGKYAKY